MFWHSRAAMDKKVETRNSKLAVETRISKFEVRPSREAEFRFSIFDFPGRVWAWIISLATAVTLIAGPATAYAQGCAMCYTTAAAAKAAAIQALRSGILILLIPPVLISIGIFALAMSRQNKFNDDEPLGADDRPGHARVDWASPAARRVAGPFLSEQEYADKRAAPPRVDWLK